MNEELISFAAQSARFLQDVTVDCCQQFFWMTIAAGIFGFLMACGIGANDVANGEFAAQDNTRYAYTRCDSIHSS